MRAGTTGLNITGEVLFPALWRLFLILTLSMTILSCTFEPLGKPTSIQIGGVFHLSGPASFWGIGERNGAVMAAEEINLKGGIDGHPLEMIVEDGKTDFTQTTTALKKLIEVDRVPAMVGPTWFGQVAAPLAEETKTPILSPSTGVTVKRKSYFFNLWPTERQEIEPMVTFMKAQNHTHLAILSSQNDWSISMKDTIIDVASRNGLIVSKEFSTAPDETDFRTIIEQLKMLHRDGRVDSVYTPFAFYPSQGLFSKQAKELNLSLQIYSSSGTENPDLIKAFPEIEGTIYPYPKQGERETEFAKLYHTRFGVEASPSSAYAYDAVMILGKILKSGSTKPTEISKALIDLNYFYGVSNPDIRFDTLTGRVTVKEHLIKAVVNRAFVPTANTLPQSVKGLGV